MIRKWIIDYIDTDKLLQKEIMRACEVERKRADASYNTRLQDLLKASAKSERDLIEQNKLELKKQTAVFNREYKKQRAALIAEYEILIKRYQENISLHRKEKRHLKKTWDIINKIMPGLNYLLGKEAIKQHAHMREMAIELGAIDRIDSLHKKVIDYNDTVAKLIGE